jgi:hypothetical protein
MMFGAMVRITRKLWTITQTATVTDETVSGILEPNPRHIDGFFTAGVINFKCTAKNNMTIVQQSVVGALGPWSAITPGGGFSTAAFGPESLAATQSNIGVGDGILRPMQTLSRDSPDTLANRVLCPVIPNFLRYSYSVTVAGAAPTVTLEVWATLVGPMIHGMD